MERRTRRTTATTLHDRKLPGWGKFCVANWLWCKELACPGKRDQVSQVLLELWSEPTSLYGRMVLLQSLCGNRAAKSKIAALFSDEGVDAGLRTEAGVCLLHQDGRKYHRDVVLFAERSPPRLQERLFDEMASPSHRESGVDPAVVRMGFNLLLQAVDKAEAARHSGQTRRLTALS